jgi:hypothetical protein
MSEICVDCGSREFKSCFTECFFSRDRDGAPVMLTLRLCLSCGARFPDRGQLRSHLQQKLAAPARREWRAQA